MRYLAAGAVAVMVFLLFGFVSGTVLAEHIDRLERELDSEGETGP